MAEKHRHRSFYVYVGLTSPSSQLPAQIGQAGNLSEDVWWSTALTWTYSSESWQSLSSSLLRLSGVRFRRWGGWRRGERKSTPLKISGKSCFVQKWLHLKFVHSLLRHWLVLRIPSSACHSPPAALSLCILTCLCCFKSLSLDLCFLL